MKATDLAQILSSLDMWGMINNYYTHHVEFDTTAHQEFSVVFDDKAVKEGYYCGYDFKVNDMDITLFLITATAFYIIGVAVGRNKHNFTEE